MTILVKNCIFLIGAYDYAAPEIIDSQDAESYSEKSDIWSIGAILLDICSTHFYNVNFIKKSFITILN